MTGNGTARPATAAFETAFRRLEKEQFRRGPAWLRSLRSRALDRFLETGFPTPRMEEWKYTSVAPITRAPLVPAFGHSRGTLPPGALDRLLLWDAGVHRLVFVDGRYAPELSSAAFRSRVRVESLAAALARDPAGLEKHLAGFSGPDGRAFKALNTAFAADGAFLEVPAGAEVERPIHLLFVATRREQPLMFAPRNLVVLGEGSRATLIESFAGPPGACWLTNAVTEIGLGPGAVLDHYKVQEEGEAAFHVAGTEVHLDSGSAFRSHLFSFGAVLSRNEIDVLFTGEGATAGLNGLLVLGGAQHADCRTFVDHAVPHGSSAQSYRGILDGRARGVFSGRVLVRPGAQKTDSRQSNKNLILSRGASADSKPQLEILADDVKCTHGAAIGELDPDAVFYLRSRGVGKEEARSMLVRAFAGEITGGIKVAPLLCRIDRILFELLEKHPDSHPDTGTRNDENTDE